MLRNTAPRNERQTVYIGATPDAERALARQTSATLDNIATHLIAIADNAPDARIAISDHGRNELLVQIYSDNEDALLFVSLPLTPNGAPRYVA